MCLGFIPSVKSRIVETTVSELAKTNVNDQSASDTGAKGQMEKQDNSNSVTAGVLRAINEVVSSNPVLGIETFMDAYDDFAKGAQTRPDEVGAPVGFNVKEFTRGDVMGALADKYLGGRASALKQRQKPPPDASDMLPGGAASTGGASAEGAAKEPTNPFDEI
jgi:hypothetical protein